MNIYWTFKQIPELRDLPKDQRKRVWQACYVQNWKVWVIALLVNLMLAFPWLVLISQVKMPTVTAAVLFVLSVTTISFIVSQVQLERLRPHFRRYLNEHKLI